MGLLQACRHDPGGPGISAVVGVQMPAGEEDAVGGASRSGSQSRRQLFANAVIGSRDHDGMAAFGAKRTCVGVWLRLPRSRMTPSRTSRNRYSGSEDCLGDHRSASVLALPLSSM